MQQRLLSLLMLTSFLLASLVACSKSVPPVQQPQGSMPDCQSAYVYAPGNFIIDIASGAAVVLDPAVHDFPLFCTPGEAAAALENEITVGRLPDGDWRIYLVEGQFNEIAYPLEQGGYGLKRMAPIVDWVTENI